MRISKQKRKELVLKALGVGIRNQRLKQKMTQDELGTAAGLHRTYVTDIESGLRNLTFMTLHRVCNALQCPVSQILLAAESLDGWHHK
jgi:transcriptional regulator with XRE-family HTH domain